MSSHRQVVTKEGEMQRQAKVLKNQRTCSRSAEPGKSEAQHKAQNNHQTGHTHEMKDQEMLDVSVGPQKSEHSESIKPAGQREAEFAAQVATQRNPVVPPKDPPSQVKNQRGPPKLRVDSFEHKSNTSNTKAKSEQGQPQRGQEQNRSRTSQMDQSHQNPDVIQSLQATISALNGQLDVAEEEQERLKNTIDRQRQEADFRIEEDRKRWRADRLDLQDQIRDLDMKLKGQEASVTRAQAAAVSLLSNTVSSSLPDDVIRNKLAELYERLQEWSRDHAVEGHDLAKSDPFLKRLIKEKIVEDPKGTHSSLIFDVREDTAAATLLSAAVTLAACRAFLGNPFFSVPSPGPKDKEGKEVNAPQFLESLFDTLYKVNEPEAHSWRAQTVQAFRDTEQGRQLFEQYCQDVVGIFMASYPELIDQRIAQNARKALVTPMRAFGEFALQLWSLKSNIFYFHLNYFFDKPFALESEEMQAARAVKLDEYDTALDKRPIQVVTRPMICAAGTPQGKDYGKKKIWAKAEVWISNKDRPQPIMLNRRNSMRQEKQGGGLMRSWLG